MQTSSLFGAIEAGGTKFVCAVARDPQVLLAQTRIATTTPAATLDAALAFFSEQEERHGKIAGIGIASFGPLDLKMASPTYGHLLATPKVLWSHQDMVGPFARRFGCPVCIDTDVNAAALAEAQLGAGRGCSNVVYVTVGTGIGGGVCIDGRTLHGAGHPEMGHIRVLRHPLDRDFAGLCPFHGDCLEGLASGPAIQARYNCTLDALPPDHVAFRVLGHYLGQLAASVILLLAPERIVFGGGVMHNTALLPSIRQVAASLLKGYAGLGESETALEPRIVAPALGERTGITGALLLALQTA